MNLIKWAQKSSRAVSQRNDTMTIASTFPAEALNMDFTLYLPSKTCAQCVFARTDTLRWIFYSWQWLDWRPAINVLELSNNRLRATPRLQIVLGGSVVLRVHLLGRHRSRKSSPKQPHHDNSLLYFARYSHHYLLVSLSLQKALEGGVRQNHWKAKGGWQKPAKKWNSVIWIDLHRRTT